MPRRCAAWRCAHGYRDGVPAKGGRPCIASARWNNIQLVAMYLSPPFGMFPRWVCVKAVGAINSEPVLGAIFLLWDEGTGSATIPMVVLSPLAKGNGPNGSGSGYFNTVHYTHSSLLRTIQDLSVERVGGQGAHRVDLRIIAATNRTLSGLVERQLFRPDLYYRLSVFPLEVPPLRERVEDIEALADHFIKQASRRLGVPRPRLTNGRYM